MIISNRQRIKTDEQKAREYKHLKVIEAERAKRRMAEGKGEDGSGGRGNKKETLGKNFPRVSPDNNKAKAKAAEAIGVSAPTAEKMEEVVDVIDALEEEGRTKLHLLPRLFG